MKTAGIVLVILGAIMLAFTGFKYVTKENVADIGPVEINKKETHTVNWTPITAAAFLVGGLIMVTASRNKTH